MSKYLRTLLLLPLFGLLFAGCGTDRDGPDQFAPFEFPPSAWFFQINGEPAVRYEFSGGAIGNVIVPGFDPSAGFSYIRSGNNTGTLSIDFSVELISEVFQLTFTSPSGGTFTMSRSDASVAPPVLDGFSGTFTRID